MVDFDKVDCVEFLCRQCVQGQSDTVDFVDLRQSRIWHGWLRQSRSCQIWPCRQCVLVLKIANNGRDSKTLHAVVNLSLTGIVDLLAGQLLWLHAPRARHLSTSSVDAPALTHSRVALLRTELTTRCTLWHVRWRSVLIACLHLPSVTLAQNADATWQWHHHSIGHLPLNRLVSNYRVSKNLSKQISHIFHKTF